MSRTTEQMLRQIKLIAEMRKGQFPNAQSFARQLALYEDVDGQPFTCSPRTISRDIQMLQKVYHAPVEYDESRRGFYLTDTNWEFRCPLDDVTLTMALFATRLAEDMAPEPFHTDLDNATSRLLADGQADFFDPAMIDSLLCASGCKSSVIPSVFYTLYKEWKSRHVVRLTYRPPLGESREYSFEPHIIAFHKGNWYAKGYLAGDGKREERVFACQRMMKIEATEDCFPLDRKLVARVRKNGLFNYGKLEGVKLHCDASIAFYIQEQQFLHHSDIQTMPDGSLVVALNPVTEHEVMRWVLSEAGRIQVLEPSFLREKIAEAAQRILEKNSSSP